MSWTRSPMSWTRSMPPSSNANSPSRQRSDLTESLLPIVAERAPSLTIDAPGSSLPKNCKARLS